MDFICSRDLCSTALKNFMKPCLKHYKNISYNVLKSKISYSPQKKRVFKYLYFMENANEYSRYFLSILISNVL
jgi:hypothetical protein